MQTEQTVITSFVIRILMMLILIKFGKELALFILDFDIEFLTLLIYYS